MEYFDRIRYLIHEKSDYKTAVCYIRELLVSQERLSEQTQKLLQLKLRYCDLKLRTISADTPKSSDKLNLHSTKLLETDTAVVFETRSAYCSGRKWSLAKLSGVEKTSTPNSESYGTVEPGDDLRVSWNSSDEHRFRDGSGTRLA